MAKAAVQHACSKCGYTTGKWLGRCRVLGLGDTGRRTSARAGARGSGAAAGWPLLQARRDRGDRLRADPDRGRRARPRARRRRARSCEPRPRLGRSRNRQVDPPAHGPAGHVARAQGSPGHRRGVVRAGQAPRRPARRCRRRPRAGRDESGRSLRDARARAARVCVVDSVQTLYAPGWARRRVR